jgi:HK97 family phage major capsid protein
MLPSMRQVPLRGRVVVTTLGGTAAVHGEAVQIKPLTSLSLSGVEIALRIGVAALVMSNEFWREAEPGSSEFLRRELSLAVTRVTDQDMVSELTSGLTGMASNGATALQVMQDIAKLIDALDLDSSSKPFILVEAATAAALSTKTAATSASFVFNQMTPLGGVIAGVPVLVCDGLTAGTVLAVDANQIAAASEGVNVSIMREGDVQMDSSPGSPPTAASLLTSMWQHNLTAIKLERRFGIEKLRTNAAALLTGVNYATSNSPA